MSVIGSFTASSLSLLLNTVGALLNSIAAISAGLSRNIQLLSGESDGSLLCVASRVAISLSSLLSSGLGFLSSTTRVRLACRSHSQSLAQSGTESQVALLREPRGNRATAYLPLLYQWKLIDAAETLLLRTNVSIDVVNISTGWISANASRNELLLLSDVSAGERCEAQKCCYLYHSNSDENGNTTFSISYRIPFQNVRAVRGSEA